VSVSTNHHSFAASFALQSLMTDIAESTADAKAASTEVAMETSAAVIVRNLPGVVLAEVTPIPAQVSLLKTALKEQLGMPQALQKLVKFNDTHVYSDAEALDPTVPYEMLLLKDETPMWTWDLDGNPCKDQIEVDGSVVKCPNLGTDYVNVITKEPVRSGVHYFEFVMHFIGDEQSCGLVADSGQVGERHGLRELRGWTYYPGRMGRESGYGDITDGKGALHAQGRAVKEFKKLKKRGDVIGMLVDLEIGAVAFDLNGELQGACQVPKDTPLWVITHVDTCRDHVELRKPCLDDAPPANLDALKGALLDIEKGVKLNSYWIDSSSNSSDTDSADMDHSD